jgi:3-methyladenine DNA glycosylase Tag
MLPIFEQAAQEFSKWSESIVFGKINMYLNEASPGVYVANFPTIKYFAADLKNKEFTFTGPRSIENLRKFIQDSSSFELQTEDGKQQQQEQEQTLPQGENIE